MATKRLLFLIFKVLLVIIYSDFIFLSTLKILKLILSLISNIWMLQFDISFTLLVMEAKYSTT